MSQELLQSIVQCQHCGGVIAIGECIRCGKTDSSHNQCTETELAKPEADPVAQVIECSKSTEVEWLSDIPPDGTLLYTSPRSMQRLTDEMIDDLWEYDSNKDPHKFANAIMDAMIEKNK